jgi:hypothetical protein
MSKRDYRRMDITQFGEALLSTRDLDPVYCMLHGARLPRPMLERWLVAYWCFYHAGAASYLCHYQGEDFWRWMLTAAANETHPPVQAGGRWPRASERRYFRGPKCVKAVEWMANQWDTPEELVAHLVGMSQPIGEPRTEKTVMAVVQEMPLFGPWIGFKVADMMERVLGVSVQFSPDICLLYSEPAAALNILREAGGRGNTAEKQYEMVMATFSKFPAPPDMRRACGPQEVETILCKWKSHMGGHYPVGKDIREVNHALQGWGDVAYHLSLQLPDSMEMEE